MRNSFITTLPNRKASECGFESCSICMMEADQDTDVTQLPCRHEFCTPCIEQWLTQCRHHCPICQTAIEAPEDYEVCVQASKWYGADVGTECSENTDLVHDSILSPRTFTATRSDGLARRFKGRL